MRNKPSGKALGRSFLLFGLSLAIAGCAFPLSGVENRGTTGELQDLRQRVEKLTEQVEKNRDNMLLMEAKLNDHQRVIDSAITKKVGETTPKGFENILGRDEVEGEITPTSVYLEAFGDFAAGQYADAIVKFETFLERFPDNNYAANAQFWLGECHFSLQQFEKAVEEFNKVVNLYPKSEKVPEALMKTVQAYRKLHQEKKADEALRFLKKHYPKSSTVRMMSEKNY